MEVALYARVSTPRQQQQQTIDQQLTRLREYVASQPDLHLADNHIYLDDGYRGISARISINSPRASKVMQLSAGLVLGRCRWHRVRQRPREVAAVTVGGEGARPTP